MNALRTASRSRFVWIVLLIVVLGTLTNRYVEHEGGPQAVVERWGIWGPLVSFTVQTVTTMTPIGAVFIAVINGMLFPVWVAITINIASGVIGGIAMYFVWRRGDHEFDIQSRMQRLPRWFARRAGDNLLFLTLLRLVPWAGGGIADLIAGSHRVPLRTQVLSLIIGYAPGSVAYALMGAGLLRIT